MKTITKRLLFAGIALCAAGLILAGIGTALGGTEYVRNTDLNRIDLAGGKSSDSSGTSDNRNEKIIVLDKTKLDSFDSIDASLDMMDFSLESSGDENCYISFKVQTRDGKNPLIYEVEDGKLILKVQWEKSVARYVNIDLNSLRDLMLDTKETESTDWVTVYVPSGKNITDLNIAVAMGEISLEDIICEKLDLQCDMGETNLSEIQCQDVNLEAGMGDISLEAFTAEHGEISVSSGAIEIQDSHLNNMSMVSEMGSISMEDSFLGDGTIELSSGALDTQGLTINGNVEIDSSMGSITLGITEECLKELGLSLHTELGEVEVSKTLGGNVTTEGTTGYERDAAEGGCRLTVEASMGDIKIR